MSLLIFFKEFVSKYRQNDPTSKTVFDHYFFDHNYYLQKNASAEDFAPILNIDTHSLDKMAVAYYGLSFIELVNEYRYQHFMQEMKNPFNDNLTIESLIKLSGFDNNESFVTYVKEKQ